MQNHVKLGKVLYTKKAMKSQGLCNGVNIDIGEFTVRTSPKSPKVHIVRKNRCSLLIHIIAPLFNILSRVLHRLD